MEYIDGKKIQEKILYELKLEYNIIQEKLKRNLKISILKFNDDKVSEVYIRNKIRKLESFSIDYEIINLENYSKKEALEYIDILNKSSNIDGIIIQLPTKKDYELDLLNKVDESKDVDCLNSKNLAKLFSNTYTILPCTVSAILEILKEQVLEGKNICIFGRSNLIGLPLSIVLNKLNSTVVNIHTKTTNYIPYINQSDIVITAVGKRLNIEDYLDNKLVIDAGIMIEDNSTLGDIDLEKLKDKNVKITPTPNGVGPITIAMLIKNIITLSKERIKL